MSYQAIREKYNDLEFEVINSLVDAVNQSNIESKNVGCKSLKVSLVYFYELVILNGNLTFLDEDGNHYGLFAETDLDDLIDILESL